MPVEGTVVTMGCIYMGPPRASRRRTRGIKMSRTDDIIGPMEKGRRSIRGEGVFSFSFTTVL